MSTETVIDRARVSAMLLGFAGRVPDDGLAMMRTFLADDDEPELAQFLAEALDAGRLPLTADEEAVTGALLARHGYGHDAPGTGARLEALPMPEVRFVPTPDEEGIPEQVAVEAAGRLDGVHALWRAWRLPRAEAHPERPRAEAHPERTPDDTAPGATNPFAHPAHDGAARVFLAETKPGVDAAELTAELQQWLAEVGEEPPRVEVFGPVDRLPPYHEAALAGAALLWTAEPGTEIRLARVFDGADPASGPFFAAGHPRADAADRDAVLAYLTGAEAVLRTPGTMVDVVERARGAVVPMSFRSDGVWIWPDTVAYYLREHGLAPDPDLVAHIRSTGGAPAPLDRLSHHRVMATLAGPAPEAPAWRVD